MNMAMWMNMVIVIIWIMANDIGYVDECGYCYYMDYGYVDEYEYGYVDEYE